MKWLLTICSNTFKPLSKVFEALHQHLSDLLPPLVLGVKSESESWSVVFDSLQPHGLYSPRNSPGQNTGVGSSFLLQGIFPTQRSNPSLLHCRQILYQLSHKGGWVWLKIKIWGSFGSRETFDVEHRGLTQLTWDLGLTYRPRGGAGWEGLGT